MSQAAQETSWLAQDRLWSAIHHQRGAVLAVSIGKAIVGGADPNLANSQDPRVLPPLHFACQAGLVEAIAPLFAGGARLHQVSDHGLTPAAHAVKDDNLDALMELQRLGAVLRAEHGFHPRAVIHPTLVHLAIAEAALGCVPALLDAGVDPMDVTSTGNNAVHLAHRFPDLLSMLSERGFSLNAVNARSGDTVSHTVVRFGGVRSWLVLLERGADVMRPNLQGVVPMEAALQAGSRLRGVTLSWLAARRARDVLLEIGREIAGAHP